MENFINDTGFLRILGKLKTLLINKSDVGHKHETSDINSLATVAISGSYNDLLNKPEIGTILRASTEITSNNISTINIPFDISDVNSLSVYHNGVLLVPNTNYTATTTQITLNNYTANSGDIFTFISTTLAGVSINPTAANVTIQDADANFTGVTTVEGALKYIADNWKPLITKITVNGTEITPNNGTVNIDVPIRSISLNGTKVSPDSNGKVSLNIDIPIKSFSLNGTVVSPDSNGKVSINNIMETNKDQTMTAKLVAKSNTNYTTKQVRNIIFVAESASSTLPSGNSGDICIVYKD